MSNTPPTSSNTPVKKESNTSSNRGRLSSVRRGKPSFAPKISSIISGNNTPPPAVQVKTEKRKITPRRGQNRKYKKRNRESAPKPKKIQQKQKDKDSNKTKIQPPPVIKHFDDRFDESGKPGTYPISLPLIEPESFINDDSLGSFLTTADSDTLMFVQLPPILPIIEENEVKPTPIHDLKNGYLGKMIVYRSGKVKMKIGDILFDVSLGTNATCLQQVAYISPEEKKTLVLGSIKQKTIITPDIENLLLEEDDNEDEENNNNEEEDNNNDNDIILTDI